MKQLSLFAEVSHGKVVDIAEARRARDSSRKSETPNVDVPAKGSVRAPPPHRVERGDGKDSPTVERIKGKVLRVCQEQLVGVIDAHSTELTAFMRQMGCQGDCFYCPRPGPGIKQVKECWSEVMNILDLDPLIFYGK